MKKKTESILEKMIRDRKNLSKRKINLSNFTLTDTFTRLQVSGLLQNVRFTTCNNVKSVFGQFLFFLPQQQH